MRKLLFLIAIPLLIKPYPGRSQAQNEKFEFSLATAHPNARALMKEDFFWNPIDDAGPFGNDDGSDAAYGFLIWRKTHKTAAPVTFLKELIDSWQFPPFAWDELDTTVIKAYLTIPAQLDEASIPKQIALLKDAQAHEIAMGSSEKKLTDEELRQIVIKSQKNMGTTYLISIDEAIIGTAFAQFALEGRISPTLKNYATIAIQRQILPLITRLFGNPDHAKAYDDKMNKLLQVVRKMPLQP